MPNMVVLGFERTFSAFKGTGYFIEKTVEAAAAFFARRSAFLKTKIEELHTVVMQKVREKGSVEEVLQARMGAQGGKK